MQAILLRRQLGLKAIQHCRESEGEHRLAQLRHVLRRAVGQDFLQLGAAGRGALDGGAHALLVAGLLAALLLMGVGAGLAGPSAYASLMNAIPLERAGVGSAMNDTVQQVGLALGIAVLGSVLVGVYAGRMPVSAPEAARESVGVAIQVPALAEQAGAAFTTAMHVGSWVGAVFCVAAAVVAAALLRPTAPAAAPEPVTA
jgi:hypothetical protein